MNTRNRIILLLAGALMGIILVFSFFIYVFISQYAFTDFYERLETRAKYAARINLDPAGAHLVHFKNEYLVKLPEERDYILPVPDAAKLDALAKQNELSKKLLELIWKKRLGTHRAGNVLYCGIRFTAFDGKEYIVVTSAKNYYFNELMHYLARLLIALIAGSVILVIFTASFLYKRILRPIRLITEDVHKIGSENLNIRLEGPETADETGQLRRTMNNMLDRLETAFETQNNFISNASHELNTPLTSIIGEADLALARPRSAEAYQESLQAILTEAEKLDKKIKALLFLAQTGFNGKAQQFSRLRIDQILFDVMETLHRLIPGHKVTLDLSALPDTPERLKVQGNEQLLHLAFSNIISNACKYSRNAPVTVQVICGERNVRVVVQDKGIGIPEKEIAHIYDPFFRASNTGGFEGYGIGLPLSRNIIKIHQGELLVMSHENGGTTVEVKLPSAQLNVL